MALSSGNQFLEELPMLEKFRSYNLAVSFYHEISTVRLPPHLRSQLLRAASSIALCLAEGYGRKTFADKTRFYQMALGSLRESQAVIQLAKISSPKIKDNIFKTPQ